MICSTEVRLLLCLQRSVLIHIWQLSAKDWNLGAKLSACKRFRSSCNIFDEPGCPCMAVIMQCLEYIIKHVDRHYYLFTCDLTCVTEILSVERVVDYFKSVTVLEQFLKEPAFKVYIVRWEVTVADDVDYLLNVEVLKWS